jgi:hypothetical protein
MSASYLSWPGASAENPDETVRGDRSQPPPQGRRSGWGSESCVTPLERHSRLLLRAYPAWYRRERAEEMLGTLLEDSPAGHSWPSFRDARALIIGGLRARGPLVWCLSMLWAGLGALGAGYNFMLSLRVPEVSYLGVQPWVGESQVIINAAGAGAVAWVLLTIPVLVAGLIRIRRRKLRAGLDAGLAVWAGTWMAGLALMYQILNWHPTAAPIIAGNCWRGQGCSLAAYRHAVVSPEELAVLAGWLALGAAMALILASTRALRTRVASPRRRGRIGPAQPPYASL